MQFQAEGTYEIEHWAQDDYDESQPSLARAAVKLRFSGDIIAGAATEYLMTNLEDGSSSFIGQIRLTGAIGGREGSLVLHEVGEYYGGNTARGTLTIVPGSGIGQLAGIRGSGAYVATHGDQPIEFAGRTWHPTSERVARYVLHYDLE
jgi:hypothetical protein